MHRLLNTRETILTILKCAQRPTLSLYGPKAWVFRGEV